MKQKGFTLLEILLVIAAIGILAAIVIIAINPQRQLAQVRDAQRQSDVNSLYKAIIQYSIEQDTLPITISGDFMEICDTGSNGTGEGVVSPECVDLRELVPTYLASIPSDPVNNSSESGYYIWRNENNEVGVSVLGENERYVGLNISAYLVEQNQVMHLDAGNETSYPGTGVQWNDLSGNNNNGELINGVSHNGQNMIFDGINDYVMLPTSPIPLTGDFTIQTWFSTSNNAKYQHIIQSYAGGPGRFTHNLSPSGAIQTFYGQASNILISSENTAEVGRYYQGTIIREGNQMSFYLNGELINRQTMTTTSIYNGTQAIGNSPDDTAFNSRGFIGNIDKVVIYDRPLEQVEILQNYYSTSSRFGLE